MRGVGSAHFHTFLRDFARSQIQFSSSSFFKKYRSVSHSSELALTSPLTCYLECIPASAEWRAVPLYQRFLTGEARLKHGYFNHRIQMGISHRAEKGPLTVTECETLGHTAAPGLQCH